MDYLHPIDPEERGGLLSVDGGVGGGGGREGGQVGDGLGLVDRWCV